MGFLCTLCLCIPFLSHESRQPLELLWFPFSWLIDGVGLNATVFAPYNFLYFTSCHTHLILSRLLPILFFTAVKILIAVSGPSVTLSHSECQSYPLLVILVTSLIVLHFLFLILLYSWWFLNSLYFLWPLCFLQFQSFSHSFFEHYTAIGFQIAMLFRMMVYTEVLLITNM